MKPNDIVVLENGLYGFCLVLEKSKHLFEIVKIDNDIARIKSLNTGVEIAVELESIRLATLKEIYLRDGNVVELDDGKTYYVSGYYLISVKEIGHYIIIKDFDDNMICKGNVYTFKVDNVCKLKENYMIKELLWQRKPKIELTNDEKVILSNLDVDKYDAIDKTERGGLRLRVRRNNLVYVSFNGYEHLFKSITHESGVHEIKELLK